MNKKELRRMAKKELNNIPRAERMRLEQHFLVTLTSSELWKNSETIGVTVSQSFEWSTREVIEKAWQDGKRIVVPKCDPTSKQLSFYHLSNFNQLETVYYGLMEPNPEKTTGIHPDDIDLLIVPGLLFNDEGYRLGFGGGFYDRFLVSYRGITVMLASEIQRHHHIPVESFDQKVDYLITEKGLESTSSESQKGFV